MEALIIVARILVSITFVRGGFKSVVDDPGGRAAKAAAIGLPFPRAMVRINGAAMLLGGLMVALGIYPVVGSALLIASLIPTTVAGYPVWAEKDPATLRDFENHILKNIGLMGGLLAIVSVGNVAVFLG